MTKKEKQQRFFETLPCLSHEHCSICSSNSDLGDIRLVRCTTGFPVPCCVECFINTEEFYSNSDQAVCSACGSFISLYDFRKFDDEWVCNYCYHKHYWECAICHNLFRESIEYEIIRLNDNDYKVCPQCYSSGNYLIHNYDYNPEFKFHKTDKDKRTLLYFGIELEVESMGNNKTEVIKQLPDFVYIKSDSSIENGFEIVSHPASYDWLRANEDKWNKILEIRKKGWRSFQTNTCGMHIHLSKRAFGNYHLYKFMRMFYDNPGFILKISQRNKRNLTQWASVKDSEKNLIYKARHKTHGQNERHTAVSLGRDKSVEIRVFKGTLNPLSFWKNVEFVKALYDFSKDYTLAQMNEVVFRNYVRFKRKKFSNLHYFMWIKNYKYQSYVNEE